MICFHFTIFVVLETTLCTCLREQNVLWFAFILLSLSYWKQLRIDDMRKYIGCDLLSFYYLCRTGNNTVNRKAIELFVVICFHFTIFVVLETTGFKPVVVQEGLWFAFILLSLSYWKQRHQLDKPQPGVVICFHFTIFVVLETTKLRKNLAQLSCDLLSFYYLCRTGNNAAAGIEPALPVVICFHFTIFVVLETTMLAGDIIKVLLWFAFILLSLSYWKQLLDFLNALAGGCDLLSFYYLCRTGNNIFANMANLL